MRTKYCIANWKMNQSINDCIYFFKEIKKWILYKRPISNEVLKRELSGLNIVICPSNVHLYLMNELNFLTNSVNIGAQNLSEYPEGAYTGEISCEMLVDMKILYTIIGHSERRQFFNETNSIIHNKLINAIYHGISPILCIGESLSERKEGKTISILREQIKIACNKLDFSNVNLILAYEPIWAIGTDVAADNKVISETHDEIRKILSDFFLKSEEISLLYGGSVNPENCKKIYNIKNVDGFLIGGASLDPKKFLNIYTQISEIGA